MIVALLYDQATGRRFGYLRRGRLVKMYNHPAATPNLAEAMEFPTHREAVLAGIGVAGTICRSAERMSPAESKRSKA